MRPSRPSMARLMAAPVTASGFVDIASSFDWSRPGARAGWRRIGSTYGVLLRVVDGLGLFGGLHQDRVGVPLAAGEVDLHAVEHRAPMPHDRRHGDRLSDLPVRR